MNTFNRYFYNLVFIFLIMLTTSFILFGQDERYEKISKDLLTRIQNDEMFQNALQVLKESRASADYTSSRLYRTNDSIFEVSFLITDKSNFYDYKKIVYASNNGVVFTYFDEKNTNINATSPVERGGCKWTGWGRDGNATVCQYNWWCKKNDKNDKQATYHHEVNTYKCDGGFIKKIHYRLVKNHCGC